MDIKLATRTAVKPGAAAVEPLGKFQHPEITAEGAPRASAPFMALETLWLNTGTLCNVACAHCYIESSPTNDALVYLNPEEASPFIIEAAAMGAHEVGFTGGEPFMNPAMLEMLGDVLARGLSALVLTNAMQPMMRPKIKAGLLDLKARFGEKLRLRASLDHFARARHDEERGIGSFSAGLKGVAWLGDNGFSFTIAGRSLWGESEAELRAGFAQLFAAEKVALDAQDPAKLVLFPEMDESADVPEITDRCWTLLGKDPADMMCAASRMVVKRKGAPAPVVLACTLIAFDRRFEMGASLAQAARPVKLNHPHCAKFCVLGGASCSG